MFLTILNNKELDAWMNERRELDRDIYSIKGEPPKEATFEDGTPIMIPVNIAWRDSVTGETVQIKYKSMT